MSGRRGRRNNYRRKDQYWKREDENVRISKTLSFLLRHGGRRLGLNIDDEGWVDVNELLNHYKVKKLKVTFEKLQEVVDSDRKGRYSLMNFKQSGGNRRSQWKIRANQGHNSKMGIKMKMKEVTNVPICVHGTYHRFWDSIQKSGLCRMSRNHIHFCAGHVGDTNVKSGYRPDCELLIYVDVGKAVKDGYRFFESDNGVILCPGDPERGYLPTRYFEKVVDRDTNNIIFRGDDPKNKKSSPPRPNKKNKEEEEEEGEVVDNTNKNQNRNNNNNNKENNNRKKNNQNRGNNNNNNNNNRGRGRKRRRRRRKRNRKNLNQQKQQRNLNPNINNLDNK